MVSSSTIMTPTSSSQLPTLFQVMALAWTYRTLVNVSWGIALRMTLVPFCAWLAFQLLNWILEGFAVLALLHAVVILLTANRVILLLSTSKESLEACLFRNRVRLPLLVFSGSCVTTYYIVGPVFRGINLDLSLVWLQSPSIALSLSSWQTMMAVSVRVITAMVLLGLAVVGRYIGPKSFMRCSSVPLLINPLDETVQTIRRDPYSMVLPRDGGYGEMVFLGFNSRGVGRSSRHGRSGGGGVAGVESEISHNHGSSIIQGRRFQHAAWTTILAQILMALLIGCAVSYTSVWRLAVLPRHLEKDKDEEGSAFNDNRTTVVVLTCAFVVTLPVLRIALDFSSHELDPQQCYASNLGSIVAKLAPVTFRNGVVVGVLSIVMSVAIVYFVSPTSGGEPSEWPWTFYSRLGVYSVLMSLYLFLLDDAVKAALFDPRFDFERLVDGFCEDTTSAAKLDVIMNSLLYSTTLTREVSAPSEDREEIKRVPQHAQTLSLILLSPVSGVPEAPFEEDIMRVSILHAMGGTSCTWRTAAFADWFSYKCPVGGASHERLCIPLVRSLCVFVTAVGEALAISSSSISRGSAPAGVSLQRWRLPPGLLFCAEFSVKSLSWCIVQSMTFPGQPIPDWKTSLLSSFVPVALSSIFHLRRGINMMFSKSPLAPAQLLPAGDPTTSTMSNSSAMIPHALSETCDDAAKAILTSLQLPKGPIGRSSILSLDEDCFLWTKSLLAPP